MQKIIGYVRVSSEEQAREGISLAMQGARITAYCENNDLELICIYTDQGISAKNIHGRPGFKAAVETVRSGAAHGLIVWKLDRAFRSTRDALATTDKLGRLGKDFISVNEKIDTTTAMGKLFFTMMAAFSQFERDVTSERTTDVLAHKRDRGEKTGGHTPFGYSFKEVQRPGREEPLKVLVSEPTEQGIIQRIQSLKASGHSFRQIASELNSEGRWTKTGKPWTHRQVARLYRRAA